jgi:hypothetical protein
LRCPSLTRQSLFWVPLCNCTDVPQLVVCVLHWTLICRAGGAHEFWSYGSYASSSKSPHHLGEAGQRMKLLRRAICDRVVSEQAPVATACDDQGLLALQDPADLLDMAEHFSDGVIKGPFDDADSNDEQSDDYPDPAVEPDETISGHPAQFSHSFESGDAVISLQGVSTSASSSSSSGSGLPVPALPVFCPLGTDIGDASVNTFAQGYMCRPGGPSLARVQLIRGSSTSYKCYKHAGCTLPVYGEYPIPWAEVKQWIASAESVAVGELQAAAKAKGHKHLAALKALRDTYAVPKGSIRK